MDEQMIFKDNEGNYYLIDANYNLYSINEIGDLIQLKHICFEEMSKRFLVFTSEVSLKNIKLYENNNNLFVLKTQESPTTLSKIDKSDYSVVEKLYRVYNYSLDFLQINFCNNKNKKYKRIIDLFLKDNSVVYFADGYLEKEDNKYFFTKKIKEEVEL